MAISYSYNSLIRSKEKEYERYIYEHINNVIKAVDELESIGIDSETCNDLRKAFKLHDKSKFSEEEFYAYRRYFHPIDKDEKAHAKDAFESAWVHHYKNNPHHPEYWIDSDGTIHDMPLRYIYEMICDWIAMGYKFNDKPYKYYGMRKNKPITPETRRIVEDLLIKLARKDGNTNFHF